MMVWITPRRVFRTASTVFRVMLNTGALRKLTPFLKTMKSVIVFTSPKKAHNLHKDGQIINDPRMLHHTWANYFNCDNNPDLCKLKANIDNMLVESVCTWRLNWCLIFQWQLRSLREYCQISRRLSHQVQMASHLNPFYLVVSPCRHAFQAAPACFKCATMVRIPLDPNCFPLGYYKLLDSIVSRPSPTCLVDYHLKLVM